MRKKGLEQITVILLFILVMIVFSFAEKDSRKLDRLYKTAQSLQHQKATSHTIHFQATPVIKATN